MPRHNANSRRGIKKSKSGSDPSEPESEFESQYCDPVDIPYDSHSGNGSFRKNIDDSDYVMTPEDVRLRIANDKNVYITKKDVNAIFKRVGFKHKVVDLHKYQIAMIHESYLVDRLTDHKTHKFIRECEPIDPERADNALPLQTVSYERLEFLGDAVIHLALADYLFHRYPDMDQGDLTTNRSKIEKKESLSKYSKALGLHKFVMIGYSYEQVNARITNPSITEDTFEAFVGALKEEVGNLKSLEFVIKVIECLEDIPEVIRTKTNYKDQLMQYFHKVDPTCRHDLRYMDQNFEDKNGHTRYLSKVYDKMTGEFLGEGQGRSKKMAQQRSAKDALLIIELIGNEDDEDEIMEVDFDIDAELEKRGEI
jgi:dsRNA-specific ribonuclease